MTSAARRQRGSTAREATAVATRSARAVPEASHQSLSTIAENKNAAQLDAVFSLLVEPWGINPQASIDAWREELR
jgi:hypothetical protein